MMRSCVIQEVGEVFFFGTDMEKFSITSLARIL